MVLMAIIELSRGLVAQVDDADIDLLSGFSWYAMKQHSGRFYAAARVTPGRGGKRALMHRFLMSPPRHLVVHHLNNDGLDNCRSNLVITTNSRNIAAATHKKDTGYWSTRNGFQCMTRIDKTRFNLGLQKTEKEAQTAVAMGRTLLPGIPVDEAHTLAKRIALSVRISRWN